MPTRILLVEDDPRQSEALARRLAGTPEYQVVGVIASIAELRRLQGRPACDLVLVDVQLADGSGIDAIRLLKGRIPPPKVVVLTVVNDSSTLFAALQAGADGYLLKRADEKGVLVRLAELLAGEVPMSAAIARRLLDHFRKSLPGRTDALESLTTSETEVLTLLARGLPNQEIASMRGVTLSTVRSQLSAIYHKLHVRNRTEAVALYHRSA